MAVHSRHGADRPALPKRGSRTALIEALTRELEVHLRGARDYALSMQERTGTPQLLPRPKMELLARKLGVHKSTVSRCFEDATARELRFLWDLAADLDRILSHVADVSAAPS